MYLINLGEVCILNSQSTTLKEEHYLLPHLFSIHDSFIHSKLFIFALNTIVILIVLVNFLSNIRQAGLTGFAWPD